MYSGISLIRGCGGATCSRGQWDHVGIQNGICRGHIGFMGYSMLKNDMENEMETGFVLGWVEIIGMYGPQ